MWNLAPNKSFHPDFDDEKDDIILLSSDGVHFRVHSVVLRGASAVFSGMLEIPQPRESPDTPSIIPLEECGETLERGLRLISSKSMEPNAFSTIAAIDESAKFCDKYGMQGGLSLLHMLANSFLHFIAEPSRIRIAEPIALHKLACTYGWQDLVEKTALQCIRDDPSHMTVFEKLKVLPTDAYFRLLSLAHRRRAAFEQNTIYKITHITDYGGCPADCVINNDHAMSAFRLSAIHAFYKHPGSPDRSFLDDLPETEALKTTCFVCPLHDKGNWRAFMERFDAILNDLPTV